MMNWSERLTLLIGDTEEETGRLPDTILVSTSVFDELWEECRGLDIVRCCNPERRCLVIDDVHVCGDPDLDGEAVELVFRGVL